MADSVRTPPTDPYAQYGGALIGPDTVSTGVGAAPTGDPYAEFGGNAFSAPVPGTGMNRYGELDEGTGLRPAPRLSTELAKETLPALGQIGLGAVKGLGSDILSRTRLAPYVEPKNTLQALGKGTEQAGEFLVPGLGEEAAISKLPEASRLAPLARIGYGALTSGAINKVQGGGFGYGALGGGLGSSVSEGMKALAPATAESALNIRSLDRAYYKDRGSIGKAILDETTGLTPGAVAESAQGRLNELNPMLEQAADRASVRPAPAIRGFLQAPEQDIPLNRGVNRGSTRGGLFPAETRLDFAEGPDLYPEAGSIPGAMEERGTPINGNERYTAGIPNPQYLPGGPHPELSGRYAPPSGVLRTREPLGGRQPVDGFGRVIQSAPSLFSPVPEMEPNPIASLAPARNQLSRAFNTATWQGERSTVGQLQPMGTHLGETMAGEPIPSNITPRQLLDLKRGFGNEFIHRWNPETMTGVKGTAGRAYHEMGQEFNRTVPEGKELNSRISNLIPVAKRGESAELNAPTAQRVMGRVAAHTGALTGAAYGGLSGYRHGGLPGAIGGMAAGAILPELIASPTGQMFGARALASPVVQRGAISLIKGAALQLNRPDVGTGVDPLQPPAGSGTNRYAKDAPQSPVASHLKRQLPPGRAPGKPRMVANAG